jgi:hypothetical protein
MADHIDAFVKRSSQDKGQSSLQPYKIQFLGAELHFKTFADENPSAKFEEWKREIEHVWRVHYKQNNPPAPKLIDDVAARETPRAMAFMLLHATKRFSHQDPDDLRKELDRVDLRLFK